MRLLLDEMHAPAVAEALLASGHDVVAVAVEPELRGCSDRGLLEYACAADQAIVTENIGDFSSLAAGWASEARGPLRPGLHEPATVQPSVSGLSEQSHRSARSVPGVSARRGTLLAVVAHLEVPVATGRAHAWRRHSEARGTL